MLVPPNFITIRAKRGVLIRLIRHCEERSDEAIQVVHAIWIASLRSQ
jgi:hypothetical protein